MEEETKPVAPKATSRPAKVNLCVFCAVSESLQISGEYLLEGTSLCLTHLLSATKDVSVGATMHDLLYVADKQRRRKERYAATRT